MPRTAMEHPGHAQVPRLHIGHVWRQAAIAEWTAERGRKTREERKFQKQRRYRLELFVFQNILEGREYLFGTG